MIGLPPRSKLSITEKMKLLTGSSVRFFYIISQKFRIQCFLDSGVTNRLKIALLWMER